MKEFGTNSIEHFYYVCHDCDAEFSLSTFHNLVRCPECLGWETHYTGEEGTDEEYWSNCS